MLEFRSFCFEKKFETLKNGYQETLRNDLNKTDFLLYVKNKNQCQRLENKFHFDLITQLPYYLAHKVLKR